LFPQIQPKMQVLLTSAVSKLFNPLNTIPHNCKNLQKAGVASSN